MMQWFDEITTVQYRGKEPFQLVRHHYRWWGSYIRVRPPMKKARGNRARRREKALWYSLRC